MTPLKSISPVLLAFILTTASGANLNGQSNPGQTFKFTVKSGYQNDREVVLITYANLKPEYLLKVFLKSNGNELLIKDNSGITNGVISLDTNDGLKELTKYVVTLRIIDKNNKVLFTSHPFQVITGKTNNNINRIGIGGLQESERLNKEFLSRNKAIGDLFFNYPYSLIEYRSSNNTVYALSYFSKMHHFVSINLHSNEKKVLNKLPGIDGLPMEASSLDETTGKFFFIGHVKNEHFLYVLDIFTGKILKEHELENNVVLFEYNKSSDKLFGIAQRLEGGVYIVDIIEIDILSGKISVIKEIRGLSGIAQVSPKIDYKKNRFLFLGDIDGRQKLISADISSGEISIVDSIFIGENSYRIHSFDCNQLVNSIYTSSIQTCAGIIGYNKENKVGFIAHIFPDVKNYASSILQEIDHGLRKLTHSGLSQMEIRVVGGKKDNNDSFYTVISIYRELLEKYIVKYEGLKVYHLGKPYNIILDAGNIDIF